MAGDPPPPGARCAIVRTMSPTHPEAPAAGPARPLALAAPVSGPVARAIAVAYAEFALTGDDLNHFTVRLAQGERGVAEVVFVPDQVPGHSVRGGSTVYGRERHYHVRLDDGSLLRTTYGR